MAVTIHDVARVADVSLATVSRVLNDSPGVSEPLRMRVLAAIDTLGYTPNENARRLSGGRSTLVGLAMPDLGDTSSEFLHAFMAKVEERGYRVVIGTSADGIVPDREMLATLFGSNIGGLVYLRDRTGGRPMQVLSMAEVPVVYVGSDVPSGYLVQPDEARAAEALVEALHPGVPRGCAVAILMGDADNGGLRQRSTLLREAFLRHGFDPGTESRPRGDYCDGTLDGGYDTTCRLVESGILPRLLAAVTDYAAIGALRALHEGGCRVPEDCMVTGFGGSIYSESCMPPLTTVAFDNGDLGRRSAEMVADLMEGKRPERRQLAGFRFIRGGSISWDKGIV